jgi:hypothetical protein
MFLPRLLLHQAETAVQHQHQQFLILVHLHQIHHLRLSPQHLNLLLKEILDTRVAMELVVLLTVIPTATEMMAVLVATVAVTVVVVLSALLRSLWPMDISKTYPWFVLVKDCRATMDLSQSYPIVTDMAT